MKPLLKLTLLLLTALLAACGEEEVKKNEPFILAPDAMITIRPAKGVQLKPSANAMMRVKTPNLTALEIVQQAVSMKMQSHYFDNMYNEDIKDMARGFDEQTMKDYNIPALKMLAIDIIMADGRYLRDFTYAKNVFITNVNGDTIAHVPDSVINNARPLIETAYENKDYEEVYRLFDEAFTFSPIE